MEPDLQKEPTFFGFDDFDPDKARRRRGRRKVDDDLDQERVEEIAEKKRRKREESPPPLQLKKPEEFENKHHFFIHWCKWVLHQWELKEEAKAIPDNKPGELNQDFHPQNRKLIREKVMNLIKLIRRGDMGDKVMDRLVSMTSNATHGEFGKASQAYMDLTIGHAKWHSDVALGEVKHNKGIKIKKIKADDTILLKDPVIKSYCIPTKRLAVFHQIIEPPEDTSKRMINA